MPIVELEKNHRGVADATVELYRRSLLPVPTTNMVKKMVADLGLTYVGHGQDCVVTKSESQPNYVVAIHCHGLTAEEAKLIYYSQRIMAILFPHNYPRFGAVFGKSPRKKGVGYCFSYRSEVVGEKPKSDGYTSLDKKSCYPFERVVQIIEELDLPIEIDRYKNNFRLGPDGGVYYLDMPFVYWPSDDRGLTRRITQFMKENQYSKPDLEAMRQCIERVRDLTRQIWKSRSIKQK